MIPAVMTMRERRLKMSERHEIVPGRGRVRVNDEPFFTLAPNRERRPTMYERTKAQVYATGNKWAIENFHATHD